MNTYADFGVIEVVDGGGSYPALLGIGLVNDSMVVIKFKKWMVKFENHNIRVIAPMDPNKGRIYVELVKDEVVKGWDHAYNISKYYIHPNVDGELGWHNASSASSDFDDALENWQNRMQKVSVRKCGLIMQSMCHVAHKIVELPIYEGLAKLSMFLMDF